MVFGARIASPVSILPCAAMCIKATAKSRLTLILIFVSFTISREPFVGHNRQWYSETEAGKNEFVSHLSSYSSPSTSFQSADIAIGTPQRTSSFAASTPKHPTDGTSAESRGDKPRSETLHFPNSLFVEEFPVDYLPELPTDLATLIEDNLLHCWKSGVCLRHPRLFLLLHCVADTGSDQQLIRTEVSPCRQGWRVLSFAVDHNDTLIRKWYQELPTMDGQQPKVRQLVPCMMCERLGLATSSSSS